MAPSAVLLPPPLGEGWGGGTGRLICSLRLFRSCSLSPWGRAALIREKLRSSARPEGTLTATRHGASFCGMGVGVSSESSLTLHIHTRIHIHMHLHTHIHMHMHMHMQTLAMAGAADGLHHGDRRVHMSRPRVAGPLMAERSDGPNHFPSVRAEKRAPQVARSEAKGRAQWGRLSLVTFFGETKKVTRPPGRHPGSGLGTTARYPIKRPAPPPPPSPRGGGSKASPSCKG
jgi:hypothetical protein